MTSTQRSNPYRSPAPKEEVPRPLEPEQEIRLILDAANRPRGIQAWSMIAFALLGVAGLVWSGLHPGWMISGLYLASPAIAALVGWLLHRRRIARLRREGYDVDVVTEKLRVADESRVRIDVPSDATTDDARMESEESEGDAIGESEDVSRVAVTMRR